MSNLNKMSIPKEIFENIFFQKGGTKEDKLVDVLAGGKQYGMDQERPIEQPNAELEGGEWILDEDGLRVVVGDSHKEGGEDMVLQDGAQVLSNYLNAPKTLINQINREHKTKIKPKATYADALSQVYKKLGLEKLQEEQKELIEKVKYQQENTKDANTQMANIELLSKKIQEVEEKKEPLLVQAQEVFGKLFEKQENSKPKDKTNPLNEDGSVVAQTGVNFLATPYATTANIVPQQQLDPQWIRDNYNQYVLNTPPAQNSVDPQWVRDDYNQHVLGQTNNLPPQPTTTSANDDAINIAPEQFVTDPPSWQILNQHRLPNYGYQPFQPNGVAGTEVDKNLATQETRRIFPSLSQKHFTDGSIRPQDNLNFQTDINSFYTDGLKSAEKLYGKDSDKYKALASFINDNSFVNKEGDIRHTDNIYGNFTSTRPNFSLELLPEEEFKKVQADGVNTAGQLKEKYPELYEEYLSSYDTPDDVWLAPISDTTLDEVVIDATNKEEGEAKTEAEKKEVEKQKAQNRMGVFNAPNQTPMVPGAMEAHLKTNRRYERMDYTQISPEQQLQELARNQVRAEQNIDLLPSSVKAGVLANMGANLSEVANKAISQVQNINNQAFQNVQNANRQIQMQEENASAQDALNFEQRQMLAKARTEADYNNWWNTIQNNQVGMFREINRANLMNHLYTDFQFTDRGIEEKGTNRDILQRFKSNNNSQNFNVDPAQLRQYLEQTMGKDFVDKLSKKPKNNR